MNAVFLEIGKLKNNEASLAGAVPDGVFYQDLKTLNPQETHHNVGFYIFRGLSTSTKL